MKKYLAALSLLLAMPTAALALQQSALPPKFPIPWGNSAGSAYIRSIPAPSQIGTQNCAASLTDGFPPLTFTPSIAGGCPPFGQDLNGILKQVTQWSQWYSAGGPIFYDSAFASSLANGYPNGAIVQSSIVPGDFWLSTADNNTTNPDAGGANWVPLPSAYQTGSIAWTWTTTVPSGWVISQQNTTIGSASSSATLASPTTQLLYVLTWNNCSNTLCPVTGGRGANAAADFAANKPIQVLNLAGSMQVGNDAGQGVLAGVPIISGGGADTNTSLIGGVLSSLLTTNLPAYTPAGTNSTITINAFSPGSGTFGAIAVNTTGGSAEVVGLNFGPVVSLLGPAPSFTGSPQGGTGAQFNNTPRAMVGYWMLKL